MIYCCLATTLLPNITHIFGRFLKRGQSLSFFPGEYCLDNFLGNFLVTLGDFLLKPTGHADCKHRTQDSLIFCECHLRINLSRTKLNNIHITPIFAILIDFECVLIEVANVAGEVSFNRSSKCGR